jgi:hypothetical protein
MATSQHIPNPATDVYFRKVTTFDPAKDIGSQAAPQLKQLVPDFPNPKIHTSASPLFNDLKYIWNLQYTEHTTGIETSNYIRGSVHCRGILRR